jgi:hypothetical protein
MLLIDFNQFLQFLKLPTGYDNNKSLQIFLILMLLIDFNQFLQFLKLPTGYDSDFSCDNTLQLW